MGAEASLCIEAMYMAVISAYIDMPNWKFMDSDQNIMCRSIDLVMWTFSSYYVYHTTILLQNNASNINEWNWRKSPFPSKSLIIMRLQSSR
jgi:hypothetical protein